MRRLLPALAALVVLCAPEALAQDDEESPRFRTVPWAAWVGAGTDFDSWSTAVGIRRGPFGLGLGYRYNIETAVPSFSTDVPPAGVSTDSSFQVSTLGVDLYTATPFADFLTIYGSLGGYADINTLLVRDTTQQRWYRSENSPDWTNARVAYGGGLELAPLEWLIVGLGYHSVRGFNMHIGYSW